MNMKISLPLLLENTHDFFFQKRISTVSNPCQYRVYLETIVDRFRNFRLDNAVDDSDDRDDDEDTEEVLQAA